MTAGEEEMTEEKRREGINVEVTEGGDCRRTIFIEVEPGLLEDEKGKVLAGLAKDVTIPGFRKGKAPKDVIQKRFAEEIHTEAIKSLLPDAYAHAVSTEKLRPIGDPVFRDISIEENEPVKFKVEVEVEPVIELKDYRDVKVEVDEVSVDDEEVDKVLESLKERYADYEPVEREAATTDVVVIDYVPSGEDGQPDESKKVEDYPVQLGAGQLFPEFEEAIIGKKQGEEGTAEISYPDDYKPERLAGQKVKYSFTLKEIKEKRLPEIDDAFASKVDEKFSSLGELREDIGRRMREEKEEEARRKMEEAAIDSILEANPFDVPGTMIDRYKGELEKEDEKRRNMAGVEAEGDAEKKKEIDALFDRIARRSIKRFFLIDRIAGLEDIRVTEADVEAEIERIAGGSGRPVDEIRPYFEKGGEQRRNLMGRLRERRVFDLVLGREPEAGSADEEEKD
jgi:trigger factor